MRRCDWSDMVGLELYDHIRDQEENYNIARDKSHAGVMNQCLQLVQDYAK